MARDVIIYFEQSWNAFRTQLFSHMEVYRLLVDVDIDKWHWYYLAYGSLSGKGSVSSFVGSASVESENFRHEHERRLFRFSVSRLRSEPESAVAGLLS